ncbi:hypothetical protein [Candidatus Halobonum tyrrellensis]|uniref:Uncharacterized protein n=1 Tax=Candidatus Halobonum tyrrellensis G22 TaxID=1324957 RepID=V4IVZ0_9EURY|nr:hypothetical protein [Candidatus Halobonum tyrrellensis]ESP87317.1 hypothetical protein K933_14563 [Candidatus Halobonum tyrrellensis G22]
MFPLQSPLDAAVGLLVRLLLLVVPFVVVFGGARLLLPRLFERLAEAGNWSANGESVLLAFALGTAATLGALVGVMLAAFEFLRVGSLVLTLGGVVTGVAVERRRRPRAPPRTELLAVVAGLLAVGVVSFAAPSHLLQSVGVFLAAGTFGGLARAAVVSVVSREPLATRVDD